MVDTSLDGTIMVSSPLRDIMFFGSSSFEAIQTPIEDIIASATQVDGLIPGGQVVSNSEITLADHTKAPLMVLKGKLSDGAPVLAHLIYARKGTRSYIFFMLGLRDSVDARKAALNELYASIELLDESLFGLDRAQTLVMLGWDPIDKDYDPARSEGNAAEGLGLLYSGLVTLTPQLQIAPDLAESWITNPEGTVFTFTLRDNLVFENGDALTTQDVKFSWERAADPATGSNTAATYLGDIVGVKDKLAGKAKEISGVKVIDDRTLEVTLDGPKPYFLAKLAYPTAQVVDQSYLEANPKDWLIKPNASGPFILREYRKDEALILERNEAYHTPSKLAYVIYRLYQSGTSQSFYESGEIDIAYLSGEDAKTLVDTNSPLVEELLITPSPCTSYLIFDNTQPPFDDANVRKAFTLATDGKRLMEVATGGTAILAKSILPPSMPGFSGDISAQRFDAVEAKTALAASKYAHNMPKIIFSIGGYANNKNDFTDALVNMWRQNLGVKVEVRYLDPQDYTNASREGHGQIAFGSWCADYPDPENFLDLLFHTSSEFNYAGYSNMEIDKLLENARVEQDGAKRIHYYQQAEEMLLADYAAIPISHNQTYVLVNPEVKGFRVSMMGARIPNLISLERE